MKNYIFAGVMLAACLSAGAQEQQEKLPAFPGAEGFGRYTTGGRGGAVYHVTKLTDDGSEGTLRWAIGRAGKRTIVFDVSGTIHLTSALSVNNANCTIAGQSAPGDGICIADYPFTINANNVIVRYIRTRLGNKFVANHEGDGLGAMDHDNIIIDHCSVSWSIDECCSVYGGKNLTVQWSIISQSLANAGHTKGAHGYGGNWGGSGCTYHHNLVAHHVSRVPRLGPRYTTQLDERLDLRNNVYYNWAGNGCYGGEAMKVNIVNNYYKPGPGTQTRPAKIQYRIAAPGIRTEEYCTTYPSFAPTKHIWGKYYVTGNANPLYPQIINGDNNWQLGVIEQIDANGNDGTFTQATKDSIKLTSPIDFYAVTTHTAASAYEKVLAYAGASLHRDAVDELIVSDTRNGAATYTGSTVGVPGMIDSQDDIRPANAGADWSAWPTLNSTAAPADTDGDGMPDTWEEANGLNKNDASDGALTAENGYTNLENYLNSLVETITNGELADGELMGTKLYEEEAVTSMTFEVSGRTHDSDNAATWTFNDADKNITITNNKGKSYGTGNSSTVKFSAANYTITIPEGMLLTAIRFSGYNNYNDNDAYIGNLADETFTSAQYVFPRNKETRTYDIQLTNPASGSVSFSIKNKQTALTLQLTLVSGSTNAITRFESSADALVNVYTTGGTLIRSKVRKAESTVGLPRGIYIVDGQKVIVG